MPDIELLTAEEIAYYQKWLEHYAEPEHLFFTRNEMRRVLHTLEALMAERDEARSTAEQLSKALHYIEKALRDAVELVASRKRK